MESRIAEIDVATRIRASLENLVFALGEATGAESSSLFVVDAERAELRPALARAESGGRLAVRMPPGLGIAGQAAESGEPIRVDDAFGCLRFEPEVEVRSGHRTQSLLCVPVHAANGRVAGVVALLNAIDRPGFTPDDEREVRALEPELSALLEACGPLD